MRALLRAAAVLEVAGYGVQLAAALAGWAVVASWDDLAALLTLPTLASDLATRLASGWLLSW